MPLEIRSVREHDSQPQEGQAKKLSMVSSSEVKPLTSDRPGKIQNPHTNHTPTMLHSSNNSPRAYTGVWDVQAKQEAQDHKKNVTPPIELSRSTGTNTSLPKTDSFNAPLPLEADIQNLEAHKETFRRLLKKLHKLLRKHKITKYRDSMENLRSARYEQSRPHTFIGFVGDTGSGKSTLINALLKCTGLAPTSNVRACTAVITEYRYNHEIETGHPFRAKVHFIGKDSWLKELRALVEILKHEDGHLDEVSLSAYTEAGIAWDKLSVVYPNIDKQQLCSMSPDDLLQRTIGSELLGLTKAFDAETSRALSDKVTKFITAEDLPNTTTREDYASVPWPLVEKVVIYMDAPLLKSGVTLVDLPGTRDSNSARSAIAEKYARDCSHLFIIATMTRAGSNKTAKNLLDDSLLRRLKLDDMLPRVTFVGTQTESIGTKAEVKKWPGMAAQIARFEKTMDDLDESLNEHEQNLQQKKSEYKNLLADVHRLGSSQKKRETSPAEAESHKRIKIDQQGSYVPRGTAGTNVRNDSSAASPGPQLSATDTTAENPSELGFNLEDLAAVIYRKADEISKLEEEIRETTARKIRVGAEEWNQIVVARDTAVEKIVDVAKDYGKFSEALTICCVSARGYQRLLGLLPKEDQIDQFKTEAQTGIPELQDHISRLSQQRREVKLKQYMNEVAVLLNSIELWVTKSSTARDPDDHESADIENALKKFQNDLNIAVMSVCSTVLIEMETSIFQYLPSLSLHADMHTTKTLQDWKTIMSQTFKAIIRHYGVFANRTTSYDFNQELADPMLDYITLDWVQYFGTELQRILDTHSASCKNIMEMFYTSTHKKAKQIGTNATVLHAMTDQFSRYKSLIDTDFGKLREGLLLDARKANRMFVSSITDSMQPIYEEAKKQRGQGSDRRRKGIVCGKLSSEKYTIFSQATDAVERSLRNTVADHEGTFLESFKRASASIEQYYTALFADSRPQRARRDPLKKALKRTLKKFEEDIEFLNRYTVDV